LIYDTGHSKISKGRSIQRTGVEIHKADGTTSVQYFKLEDGAVMLEPDVRRYFQDSESVKKIFGDLCEAAPAEAGGKVGTGIHVVNLPSHLNPPPPRGEEVIFLTQWGLKLRFIRTTSNLPSAFDFFIVSLPAASWQSRLVPIGGIDRSRV